MVPDSLATTLAATVRRMVEVSSNHNTRRGTVKLSSLAAFSPPAATAKSLILNL